MNNQLVIERLIEEFDWRNKEKTEIEFGQTFEYEIKLNMLKEKTGEYTLTCALIANGEWFLSFPIGWNYTRVGITRKADQLLKAVEKSFKLEQAVGIKNRIKRWGWEVTSVEDMFKDM